MCKAISNWLRSIFVYKTDVTIISEDESETSESNPEQQIDATTNDWDTHVINL